MMNLTLRLLLPLSVLGALACGSSTPPANTSGSGDVLALSPSTASAATTAAPMPTETASAAPAASSAPVKAPRAPSAGPMAVSENEKEVSAPYGSNGGISRLSGTGAEFAVPRNAVPESLGFLFAINAGKSAIKFTPYKGQMGDSYHLFVFRESDSNVGHATTSASTPFLVKLPIKGAKTANLAVGTVAEGKVSKWSVIAPKSVAESDGPTFAVFELPSLSGDSILLLTNQPPTP